MKHLFVPYEIAVKAKKYGFNEECIAAYQKTPKHLVKNEGEICLRTHGNPFGNNIGGIFNNSLKESTAAPIYQQLIDWFREKGVKIHEAPEKEGYHVRQKYEEKWIIIRETFILNEAIEEAFKLILTIKTR